MFNRKETRQSAKNTIKKLLLVSPCMGQYGGLEAFVLSLGEGLARESEFEVSILFKRAGPFNMGHDLAAAVAKSRVAVQFCEKASSDLFRAIRDADLVHVQNPCPDVVMMARTMRKPLLVSVINHLMPGRSFHQKLWQWCLAATDRRLYISEFVRSTWEADRRLRESHVVFPLAKLPEGRLPVSQRRGFAFIGRWIENKGIDTLVRAYHRAGLDSAAWPLRLMGQGPLIDSVRNYVNEHGVRGIEILGFVDDERKAQVMRSARFMVIPPNTGEDFGLTAVEARNLGVPCIITRDGGLPEAAGKFVVSAEPGDVDDLARALREAAGMTVEAYTELSENSYRSLQDESVCPADYIRHYREVLSRKGVRTVPVPVGPLVVDDKLK